jgi:hypothetical protein
MRYRAAFFFVIACTSACASSANGPAEATVVATPVPVFDSVEDIPCQYEVIRRVRGESDARTGGSPTAFERERVRVLGREGARMGADAVLVEPVSEMVGVQRRVVVSAPAGSAPRIPSAPNLRFEGDALRYLDETCPTGR